MKGINPYINFNGDCEEAFNFYKSVFGGEFIMISKFDKLPESEGMQVEENEKDLILHVSFPIGKVVLMGSDMPASMGRVDVGNNIQVSVATDSEEEADKIFNGLKEGGKVTMPLAKQFWNSYFGSLTDKFGINWMISFDYG